MTKENKKKRLCLALLNAEEFIRGHAEVGLSPEDVNEETEEGLKEYTKACKRASKLIRTLAKKNMKKIEFKIEKQEYPIAGDNEKTLEIIDGVVMCKFIPQYLYTVTKYYLRVFGFKILLYSGSKTKNYFSVTK